MTKARKTLDDSLAQAFVFGDEQSDLGQKGLVSQEESKPNQPAIERKPQKNLMDKLQPVPKEPTIRFTADLPESLHKKLSMLAARTGKKKVDIVRLLLAEALEQVD